MKAFRVLLLTAATVAAGSLTSVALAQTSEDPGVSSRSLVPGKARVAIGPSLGRSRYGTPCGATSLNCDSTDNSVQLYAGAMPSDFWGVELGYIDMGRLNRAGGAVTAQGLNFSLVGKTKVWNSLAMFGRVGTTYGRTEANALLGSGVGQGTERGFGLSYGAGVSYDFTPRLSATLGWDSHDFQFAGSGRDPVRATSLGLQYRY